jgi:hypothetical protein
MHEKLFRLQSLAFLTKFLFVGVSLVSLETSEHWVHVVYLLFQLSVKEALTKVTKIK